MNRWSGRRLLVLLLAGAAIILAVGALGLLLGTTGFGWPKSHDALRFRLEDVVDSAIVGAALAAAGCAYQAVLRNPLADPYLLGVSSGGALMRYIWIVGLAGASLSQEAATFLGSVGAIAIVLAIAGARGRLQPVTLILVGVIVNAINGSIYLLLSQTRFDVPATGGMVSMLVGKIQPITPSERAMAGFAIFAGWMVLLFFSGQLNIAALEDTEAKSLGVRIQRLRLISLLAASLMTAAAVAISGPIGFVGLICPHIGRWFVGPDQRKLFPVSTILGAVLLILAESACRVLTSLPWPGTELQVGILTGLLGGPFFLWLLISKRSV
jgi:iron complex transport system permease protein